MTCQSLTERVPLIHETKAPEEHHQMCSEESAKIGTRSACSSEEGSRGLSLNAVTDVHDNAFQIQQQSDLNDHVTNFVTAMTRHLGNFRLGFKH